jgi:hypothetical protein
MDMCWHKKPDPIPITGDKVALLFGINDYMGSGNDLSGCLNDIDDVEKKLNKEFPGFQIKKFKDSQVTTQRFVSEIELALLSAAKLIYIHYSGHGTTNNATQALYLYNGPLWENAIYDLEDKTPADKRVIAKFDSCFSGGLHDRIFLLGQSFKNRFYPMPGIRALINPPLRRFADRDFHKWDIWAACGPGQTAADAFFNNRANGAYTYFDNKSYNPTTMNCYELTSCVDLLKINSFEQVPEYDGHPANIVFT